MAETEKKSVWSILIKVLVAALSALAGAMGAMAMGT